MKTTLQNAKPAGECRRDARVQDKDGRCQPSQDGQEDVHYVHHPSFSLPATGQRLWGPERDDIPVEPFRLASGAAPDPSQAPAPSTTLTPKEEKTLFLRYNYAKYRRRKLAEKNATFAGDDQKALWRKRARDTREKLIHANLPLVLAMAKKKRVDDVEFADKAAEGYMVILRCIEYFDVSRGYKFSTYACRSILSALYRLGSKAQTYRRHVPVHFDPALERDDYNERRSEQQRADVIQSVRLVLARNDADLNQAQEYVIRKRFPVGSQRGPEPRWRIGRDLGVSTERVRQIEKASLSKLAAVLDDILAA